MLFLLFYCIFKGPFTCIAGGMNCCCHVLGYDAEDWGPWRSIPRELPAWPAPAGGELSHWEGIGMELPNTFVILMFSRLFLTLYWFSSHSELQ